MEPPPKRHKPDIRPVLEQAYNLLKDQPSTSSSGDVRQAILTLGAFNPFDPEDTILMTARDVDSGKIYIIGGVLGYFVSVVPATDEDRAHGEVAIPGLEIVDLLGNHVKTYGTYERTVDCGQGFVITHPFIVADVLNGIVGYDCLARLGEYMIYPDRRRIVQLASPGPGPAAGNGGRALNIHIGSSC